MGFNIPMDRNTVFINKIPNPLSISRTMGGDSKKYSVRVVCISFTRYMRKTCSLIANILSMESEVSEGMNG